MAHPKKVVWEESANLGHPNKDTYQTFIFLKRTEIHITVNQNEVINVLSKLLESNGNLILIKSAYFVGCS